MLTLEMIAAMLLWPALATALVVATAWVPAVARSRLRALVAPAAIAVGFVAGYAVVVGRPELSPAVDAKAYLPHLALFGAGLGAVAALSGRRWLTVGASAAASVAAMWLVLGAAIEFQWTGGQAALRVGVLAVGLLATVLLAARFVATVPPRTGSLGLVAVAGIAAPIMLFSDSLLMAQLHGTLGVAVGVAVVALWLSPARLPLSGAAPVVVMLAWAHWVIGLVFANMPVASFVLLSLAAPAAVAVGAVVDRWRPQRHALAALVALGVLVASSLAVGGLRYARTSSQDAAGTSDSDYGYYQ